MTTPAIQAIETEYAGYRFRSRLEARWAVFFDALDVRWEYEPQGVTLGNGVQYLPDFFLPNTGRRKGLYVEVKGVLDADGAEKVIRVAAADQPIALVGDIPAAHSRGPHFHLLEGYEPERLPGSVAIWQVSFLRVYGGSGISPFPFGFPLVVRDVNDSNVAHTLTDLVRDRDLSRRSGWVETPRAIAAAFDAARQARFEHGESGAPRAFVRRTSPRPATTSDHPHLHNQREVLKAALQMPEVAGPSYDDLPEDAFTHPAYVCVHRAVLAAGGTVRGQAGPAWLDAVLAACLEKVRALVKELAVEPLDGSSRSADTTQRYVANVITEVRFAGLR